MLILLLISMANPQEHLGAELLLNINILFRNQTTVKKSICESQALPNCPGAPWMLWNCLLVPGWARQPGLIPHEKDLSSTLQFHQKALAARSPSFLVVKQVNNTYNREINIQKTLWGLIFLRYVKCAGEKAFQKLVFCCLTSIPHSLQWIGSGTTNLFFN